MRILFPLSGALFLCGCISSGIAVDVDNRPETLKGLVTGNFLTATFYVEDSQGLLCTGAYDWLNVETQMETDFRCSDGRSGRAYLDLYGEYRQHGQGTGVLSDGTELRVYLGDEAKKHSSNSL